MVSSDPKVISIHYRTCAKAFNLFINAFRDAEDRFKEQVPLLEVESQLGRLRVWAGNLGVHQTGKSSLDHRLRYAEHIRQKAISLLDDLNDALCNGL